MSSDQVKQAAIMGAHQPRLSSSDPTVDMMLQSLMIDDTEIKRILKGEIQEPLDRLKELVDGFSELLVECSKDKKMVGPAQFGEFRTLLIDLGPVLSKIDLQLSRYYRMVPYLLVLSPLTRLSNLTAKQVEALCRRVSIMVGRDKLMSVGDAGYEDRNFWDALEMQCHLAIHDSEGGWKMRGVTEEVRKVETLIKDQSGGGSRKRKWGLF